MELLWTGHDFNDLYYIKSDILSYFFTPGVCKICGKKSLKGLSKCNKCTERLTLKNNLENFSIELWDIEVQKFYKNFVLFLFKCKLSYKSLNKIIKNSEFIFNNIQDEIKTNKKIVSIKRDVIEEVVNRKWITKYLKKKQYI